VGKLGIGLMGFICVAVTGCDGIAWSGFVLLGLPPRNELCLAQTPPGAM
jgi:hypothetical protein